MRVVAVFGQVEEYFTEEMDRIPSKRHAIKAGDKGTVLGKTYSGLYIVKYDHLTEPMYVGSWSYRKLSALEQLAEIEISQEEDDMPLGLSGPVDYTGS